MIRLYVLIGLLLTVPSFADELSDLMAPPSETETLTEPETLDPVATEPPSLDSSSPAGSSEATYDAKHPRYKTTPPSWAFQPMGSLSALSDSRLPRIARGIESRSYGFQVEFFPHFLHKIGGVSLGSGLLLYQPTAAAGDVLSKQIGLWSWTFNGRWQLRFLREQPLVPIIGYEAEQLHYNFKEGPHNTVWSMGPTFGAMLLLNFLEPDAASDGYHTNGIVRTYFFGEFRNQTGTNGEASISGRSLFFGIRIEGAT